jgi:RimJ/RimL family protein N-acetyltransferase
MSVMRIGDGVVTLRPPDERDLPAIETGIHDPDVVRWVGPPEGTAEEVLRLDRNRWAAGSPTFAICAADDECVGLVWLNRRPSDTTSGSIGYWLLPDARGMGLASRSVRLVVQWAFEELGCERLRITVSASNRSSQGVAERCGFAWTGRTETVVAYELLRPTDS